MLLLGQSSSLLDVHPFSFCLSSLRGVLKAEIQANSRFIGFLSTGFSPLQMKSEADGVG